jgi:hypothetical protein
MPGTHFIPPREPELNEFAINFNTKIAASPTTYGLTAAQATAFTVLFNAWTSAYTTAITPATRTHPAIVAKNQAKVNMVDGVGGIRQLARIVQAAPGVTAQQKADLGLPVRDSEPTPVPPPQFAPSLTILSTMQRIVKIRLRDVDNPDRRGMPDGVDGAAVLYFVGEDAPDNVEDWSFMMNTTRTLLDVEFPATIPAGSKVWLTAFWFNQRKESGPAAAPQCTNIASGLAQAA